MTILDTGQEQHKVNAVDYQEWIIGANLLKLHIIPLCKPGLHKARIIYILYRLSFLSSPCRVIPRSFEACSLFPFVLWNASLMQASSISSTLCGREREGWLWTRVAGAVFLHLCSSGELCFNEILSPSGVNATICSTSWRSWRTLPGHG